MTKQLRKRIMIILMLLLSSTFIAIIVAINLGLNQGNRNTASENLQFLMQREGRPGSTPGDGVSDESKQGNPPEDGASDESKQGNPPGNGTSDESKQGNPPGNGTSDESKQGNPPGDDTSGDKDNISDKSANEVSDDTSSQQNTKPSDKQNNSLETDSSPRPPEIPDNGKRLDARHMELATSHYILVRYTKDKTLSSINNTLSDSYSDEDIEKYCEQILSGGKQEGTIDELRYLVREGKDEITIAFIDHSAAVQTGRRLMIISTVASVFAVALFAFLSYILSGWLVKPVEEAFTKQKQFISDASHELKTPITVILSNSELLEDQIGENKQLSYIKKECDQMHYLVTSLLTLTRLEQTPYKDVEKNDFCISDTVLERILPIESVAFEKGVMMDYDKVTPDLKQYGVKEQIGQVASILIDNAITHTDKGGTITLSLWKTPHHIHLTVANTGKEIPVEERERLFERFYRADESRHRASGHFGLGLSIAKTIVTNHKGKISVDCADGITTFYVKLPDTGAKTRNQ